MTHFGRSAKVWRALTVSGVIAAVALLGASGLGGSASVRSAVATPYTVTFSETGLPSGTNWSVHVAFQGCGCSGVYRTGTSNLSTLTIPITNGTYKYHVLLVPNFYVNASFLGELNVSGANVTGPTFVFHPLVTYTAQFQESGLPAATNWSVSLHGNGTGQLRGLETQTRSSVTPSINFTLPNGTYHFTVAPVAGSFFIGSSSHGSFVVAGPSPTVPAVRFTTPPLFAVTIVEHGLVNDTNWSAAVGGFGGVPVHERSSTTTDSITFELPNGTYHYSIGEVLGFVVNGSTVGSFLVGHSPLTINISFHPVAPGAFYPVAFQETGLANGTHWFVTVFATHTFGFSRKEVQSSNGTNDYFLLQNSSYRYQVHGVRGYQITAGGSGTFGIYGSSPSVFVVTFRIVPTYTVTYNETGLPNGTNWSGLLRSTSPTSTPWPIHIVEKTNGTSIQFTVPNGSYCFVIYAVPGFRISSGVAAGSLSVAGGPASVSVTFTPRA